LFNVIFIHCYNLNVINGSSLLNIDFRKVDISRLKRKEDRPINCVKKLRFIMLVV
jgi:hypothetical protein